MPYDDYSGNISSSGRIAVNNSITGSIDSNNDQDWFRVSLAANTAYTINLEGSPTGRGTLVDTYLRGIYTPSGALIAGTTDDDSGTGNNSRVIFTPLSSGDYFIAAGAYGSNTGSYSLAVSSPSPTTPITGPGSTTPTPSGDDYSGSESSSGRVSVNSSTSGSIDFTNDQDWFRVSLSANTAYTINLEGSPTGRGTLLDTYLRGIYTPSGALIAGTTDDDSGTGNNSRVTFTPPSSGDYIIAAGAYGLNTGTYTLAVSGQSSTSTPSPTLYWCTRDLAFSGGGNHHFLWIDGGSSAIPNETLYDGRPGTVIGATDFDGRLTAYSSTNDVSHAADYDAEAIIEYLTGRIIGWTNEDLQIRQIPTGSRSVDSVVTDLMNAWNNYRETNLYVEYNLLGGGNQLSGNCAAWVNTILDVVGLPLTDNFGDFNGVDRGQNHIISAWAFI